MDEGNDLRTVVTSHPLESDVDEHETHLTSVVWTDWKLMSTRRNGQAPSWRTDALIDGLVADTIKAGDDREITQVKNLQLSSWIREDDVPPHKSILLTGWARRMQGNEVRWRCVLKDFARTVRVDVVAPTTSPVSVIGLLLYAAWNDLCVDPRLGL